MNLDLGDTRLIIDECAKEGLLRNQAAYVLATAKWETAHTIKPVRETLAKTDKQAMARLESAWKKGQLKWVKTPYWRTGFFGRGYVQLTHEYNYAKAGKKLGLPLVDRPEKVMEPGIASKILVRGSKEGWFTGKKLGDFLTASKTDWRGARRIINGTDKAATIAAIAEEYNEALAADGYGTKPAKPNWLSAIIELIKSILRGLK